MADALDLGSSVFDVRVQVPYPVPSLPSRQSVKWILKVSTTAGVETKYYSLNMKKENTTICRILQTLNKKQSKTFRALTIEGCWF